jgi:hypothetical protein
MAGACADGDRAGCSTRWPHDARALLADPARCCTPSCRRSRRLANLRRQHARRQADGDRLTDVRAAWKIALPNVPLSTFWPLNGLRGDALHLREALLNFLVDARSGRCSRRCRLDDFTDALQVVRELAERALRRLRERYRRSRCGPLIQAVDLS